MDIELIKTMPPLSLDDAELSIKVPVSKKHLLALSEHAADLNQRAERHGIELKETVTIETILRGIVHYYIESGFSV